MADDAKKFEILITSKAEMGGAATAQKALALIKDASKGAQQSTLDLGKAHKEAGAAAEEHGHGSQVYRTAVMAGSDAARAFSATMRGDYVVALHEAKFAMVDLKLAMAGTPWGIWIAGATLGATVLAHFISESGDAKTAVADTGETAKKAAEKWMGLHEAVASADRELAASVDPMEKQSQALTKMGEAASASARHYGDVEAAARQAREAVDLLIASYDDQAKKITALAEAERALRAEKARTETAVVNVAFEKGEISAETAAARHNRNNRDASLEDIQSQEDEFHQKLTANMQTAGASQISAERASAAKKAAHKNYAEAGEADGGSAKSALQDYVKAGGSIDEFNKGNYQAVAKGAREKYLETAPVTAESNVLGDLRYQAILRLGKAYVDLQEKQRASMVLDQADAQAQARLKEIRDQGALQVPVWNQRRKTIEMQFAAEQAKAETTAEVRRNEDISRLNAEAAGRERAAREGRRKAIDFELSQAPMSEAEEGAAAADLRTKRTTPRTADEEARNQRYQQRQKLQNERSGLNTADAKAVPDFAESKRQQDLLTARQQAEQFKQLPVDSRVAMEALDATNGRADRSTVSGGIADQIREVSQLLLKGDHSKGGTEQIENLMRQFLDAVKEAHKPTERAEARFKQIETELQTVRAQLKASRS